MFNFRKTRELILAFAMVVFAAGASALPVSLGTVGLSGISPVDVSLPFSGTFSNAFTFKLGAGNGLQLGLVTSFWGDTPADAPSFTVDLAGGSGAGSFTPVLAVDADSLSAGLLLGGLAVGDLYTLVISGSDSANLGLTYSLHLAANTVAEPETLLLILASLGVMGATIRRKSNVVLVQE